MAELVLTEAALGELIAKHASDAVSAALAQLMAKQVTDNAAIVLGGAANAKAQRQPGEVISRMVRAIAASKGVASVAADVASKVWPGDTEVQKALAANIGSAGGFFVPEEFSSEVIELLRPASVVMASGPIVVPLPNGNVTMPGLATGTQADYIGENTAAGATSITARQIKLTARKLAALVPISNDLLRFATPSVDALVRNDLVRAISQRADLAFIRGDGSGNTPKGLLNFTSTTGTTIGTSGAVSPNPNRIAANGGGSNMTFTLASITQDLGKLELALMQSNVAFLNTGWLMAPRTAVYLQNLRDGNGNLVYAAEMATGKLRGKPYKVTTQIPINLLANDGATSNASEIYLVEWADAMVGEAGSLILDVSDVAAYVDAGGNTQAPFSLDQTVIRAIVQHDFGMRHDQSVAVLTGVNWS